MLRPAAEQQWKPRTTHSNNTKLEGGKRHVRHQDSIITQLKARNHLHRDKNGYHNMIPQPLPLYYDADPSLSQRMPGASMSNLACNLPTSQPPSRLGPIEPSVHRSFPTFHVMIPTGICSLACTPHHLLSINHNLRFSGHARTCHATPSFPNTPRDSRSRASTSPNFQLLFSASINPLSLPAAAERPCPSQTLSYHSISGGSKVLLFVSISDWFGSKRKTPGVAL